MFVVILIDDWEIIKIIARTLQERTQDLYNQGFIGS